MNIPLVSIIIPAFNSEDFIQYTLDSIINQTYKNWEAIIVDDGSTDNTSNIVKSFLIDNRFKLVQIPNSKQGKARNIGISQSNGDFIALLDSDDIWGSDKLERQLDVLLKNNYSIVFSQGFNFYNNTDKIVNKDSFIGILEGESGINLVISGNKIIASSVIGKRSIFIRYPFTEDHSLQNCEDLYLWFQILYSGFQIFGMKDRLVKYRIHEKASTSINISVIIPEINICLLELNKANPRLKRILLNKLYRNYNRLLTYYRIREQGYNLQKTIEEIISKRILFVNGLFKLLYFIHPTLFILVLRWYSNLYKLKI